MSEKKQSYSDKAIEIIQWYETIPDDFLDILTMINKRRLLSSYRFHISKSFGIFKMKYRMGYARRKIGFNKEKNRLIDSGTSGVAADAAAEVKVEEERLHEATYEGRAESAKTFLDSIDKVLESMNQQISYLKQEKESEMKYSQGQP